MIKGFIYKYNDNENSWNHLVDEYKKFEIKFNEILKKTYKSVFDERKREFWLTKKAVFKIDIDIFSNKFFNLIKSNFKNSFLITTKNKSEITYLTEKKTNRIYKIEEFGLNNYYYSSVLDEGIVIIRFTIIPKGKKIILYYKNCYYTKKIINYTTLSDTIQKIEIRKQFNMNWMFIKDKLGKIID